MVCNYCVLSVTTRNLLIWGAINTVNFAAETFLRLARPFLGDILDRLEIYGNVKSKWKAALFRKIPQEQLPPRYGGSNKDSQPLPLLWRANVNRKTLSALQHALTTRNVVNYVSFGSTLLQFQLKTFSPSTFSNNCNNEGCIEVAQKTFSCFQCFLMSLLPHQSHWAKSKGAV